MTVFVPPAWLLSPAEWHALAAQTLRYACTLRQMVRVPDGAAARVPALVFGTRPDWRRKASPLWNRALALSARSSPQTTRMMWSALQAQAYSLPR